MSETKKKVGRNDFKAIKLTLLYGLLLFLLLFFANRVFAATIFESFEDYSTGLLSGQGEWETPYGGQSCEVETIRAFDGSKSISVQDGFSSCGATKEIATTTTGFLSFVFYADNKDDGLNILYYLGTGSGISLTNDEIVVGATTTLPNSENWEEKRWHQIGIEIDTEEGWIRGKYDNNYWSATTTWTAGPVTSLLITYNNGNRNEQDFFIDSLIVSGSYDEYTYEEMGLASLPELEDCSGYSLTDRLLCELKNFFYRLFVPSPEKITELKQTLNTIKTKFPYSYILEIQNFFENLKDNLDEDQEISFSVLGNSGTINFSVWETETTLAGSSQTILNIIKSFFKFVLVLIFALWFFSFIKRIFK